MPGDPKVDQWRESNPLPWGTHEVQLRRPMEELRNSTLHLKEQICFHAFESCAAELDKSGTNLLPRARQDRNVCRSTVPPDP